MQAMNGILRILFLCSALEIIVVLTYSPQYYPSPYTPYNAYPIYRYRNEPRTYQLPSWPYYGQNHQYYPTTNYYRNQNAAPQRPSTVNVPPYYNQYPIPSQNSQVQNRPTNNNPAVSTPRVENPYYGRVSPQTGTRESFGESVIPHDCVGQACCRKGKEKWSEKLAKCEKKTRLINW